MQSHLLSSATSMIIGADDSIAAIPMHVLTSGTSCNTLSLIEEIAMANAPEPASSVSSADSECKNLSHIALVCHDSRTPSLAREPSAGASNTLPFL